MTNEAKQLMREIAAGYESSRFHPLYVADYDQNRDAAFSELAARGLIINRAINSHTWFLTDAGRQWALKWIEAGRPDAP